MECPEEVNSLASGCPERAGQRENGRRESAVAGTVWHELRGLHVTEGAAGAVDWTVRTLHNKAGKKAGGEGEDARAGGGNPARGKYEDPAHLPAWPRPREAGARAGLGTSCFLGLYRAAVATLCQWSQPTGSAPRSLAGSSSPSMGYAAGLSSTPGRRESCPPAILFSAPPHLWARRLHSAPARLAF